MKGRCLTPKCKGLTHSRGLCSACYQHVRELVKVGHVTWSELEEAGLSAKPGGNGRGLAHIAAHINKLRGNL